MTTLKLKSLSDDRWLVDHVLLSCRDLTERSAKLPFTS
jgi:hypothetical protein